jgi:hypothetical protein
MSCCETTPTKNRKGKKSVENVIEELVKITSMKQ